MKGIEALRSKLSKLLFNHLKNEIPKLKQELDSQLELVNSRLEALGEKRGNLLEQRLYLTRIFMEIHDLLDCGLRGIYENSFFGTAETNGSTTDAPNNAKRLRAIIQFLNLEFAGKVRTGGHAFSIEGSGPDDDEPKDVGANNGQPVGTNKQENPNNKENEGNEDKPGKLTRLEALDCANNILVRNRGRELPGLFNPMLVSQLFLDQSRRWRSLAEKHIEVVATLCKKFVNDAVSHVASPDIAARLITYTVDPSLEKAENRARKELEQLFEDAESHPITYNHYFTDNLQKK
jgi:dynamin family protein